MPFFGATDIVYYFELSLRLLGVKSRLWWADKIDLATQKIDEHCSWESG